MTNLTRLFAYWRLIGTLFAETNVTSLVIILHIKSSDKFNIHMSYRIGELEFMNSYDK